MCGKLVMHPVHHPMYDRSCVNHGMPPPSEINRGCYKFNNITFGAVFVKIRVA